MALKKKTSFDSWIEILIRWAPMKKHGFTTGVIWTAFSERMKNHTLFFLLNLDLQWRREKSRDVETTGRGRILYFQLQKVCLPYVSCPNNEVKSSLYRIHG
ncbi:hypothetical protein Hanom_Chr05g00421441 [Helianthus anomalus]